MGSQKRASTAGKMAAAAAVAMMMMVGGCAAMLGAVGTQISNAACVGSRVVGATEYGGPGDPTSGHIGSSGVNLDTHPDSYAELGGTDFQTATNLGGLPYGTPLLISWHGRTIIAYKRDIGLGGGPIDGHRRVIDLWWGLVKRLGIPYEDGAWSGLVTITRAGSGCQGSGNAAGVGDTPEIAGARARIGPGDRAQIPKDVPAAVKGILAAGNQIVGKPYVYGGGHGIPLNEIAPSYDCSSSVSHLLWGGGLLAPGDDMDSTEFMSWGKPGPGKWVTIWASPIHVFMYVDGIRWDTHNAAGADDGPLGIGWHPLVREDEGFVERHPAGL